MNKAELLAKLSQRKPKVVKLECDDIGTVFIREMSGTQRDLFEIDLQEADLKATSVRAILVCKHLCDESGELLGFTDAEREQFADAISGAELDRMFDACRELSGMVEDHEGN